MATELRTLGEQLRDQHGLAPELCALKFRAGVALGDIQPIWQDRGTERYASWVECGSSHAFVESARLMDLERKAPEGSPPILAVFNEEAARELDRRNEPGAGRWVVRDLEMHAKHGTPYRVALYEPVPSAARGRHLRLVS
jgi:hypothetical protein